MAINQDNADVYVAVIIYESFSKSPEYKPLFEESFLMIKASSIEEAKQKSLQCAIDRTSIFKNEAGDSITWNLKHILDVNQVLKMLKV